MKYSVKMIVRHTVETGEVFLEESIIMLNAVSFDDAYLKAEQYAKDYVIDQYRNMYGKRVRSDVISYADCFSVYDDEDPVEVWSSIIRPRDEKTEDAYLSLYQETCSREEMLPLRQWPDPEHPEEMDMGPDAAKN